uniref:Uncharacterized protein n=1 Tax=Arundo donax TaxID=35708 RepID=A0A0A9KD28_ARUDO
MCGSSLMAELSASPPSSCSASMTRLLDGLLIHSHLKKLPDLYALDWRERGREQLIEHVYGCTVKWRAMKFCAKVSEVEGS